MFELSFRNFFCFFTSVTTETLFGSFAGIVEPVGFYKSCESTYGNKSKPGGVQMRRFAVFVLRQRKHNLIASATRGFTCSTDPGDHHDEEHQGHR